jgi:hypothetical protein
MQTILTSIAKIITIPLVSVLTFAGYDVSPHIDYASNLNSIQNKVETLNEKVKLGAYNPSGGGNYRLQSSVGLSATTINLSSFKEPISNLPYTMSYLGSSIAYGTLDPQTANRSEFISFTGITQNSDGTAQLTGVTRGLSRTPGTGGCVASTTLAQAHSGQSIFILSNSPCFYAEYAVKRNDETITGSWSFPTPTIGENAATKDYTDGKLFGGIGNASETATGTVEIATQTEASTGNTDGTKGRLVLPASIATSTWVSGSANNRVIVTKATGKIDDNFISTSTLFAGPITIMTTSTTTLATTTINGGNIYGVIASTTLLVSSPTMSINIPPRDNIRIVIFASTTDSNTDLKLNFNSDTSANYTWTSATTTHLLQSYWGPFDTYNDIGKFAALVTIDTVNFPTAFKLMRAQSSYYNASNVLFPSGVSTSTLMWRNSTDKISSIQASLKLSGVFAAGSFIKVYGEMSNP